VGGVRMTDLTLRSICPDGVEIVTPFPAEWNPKSPPALDEHADVHRNAVRTHLWAMRLLDKAA
jgi:hypothetical protein